MHLETADLFQLPSNSEYNKQHLLYFNTNSFSLVLAQCLGLRAASWESSPVLLTYDFEHPDYLDGSFR